MNEQEALEVFRQRAYMLSQVDKIVKDSVKIKKATANIGGGMAALLGEAPVEVKTMEVPDDFPAVQLDQGAKWEKETLGFYVTWNPIEPYRKQLTSMGLDKINTLIEKENKSQVRVGGMVTEVLIKKTKKGDDFAIVKLESIQAEESKIIFWPKIYEICKEDLVVEKVVIILGIVEIEEETMATVFANDLVTLDA